MLTTDGPFVEAKEHLGGFYMIDAEDLDAALGWAAKVTRCIGSPIEVWPLADFADEPRDLRSPELTFGSVDAAAVGRIFRENSGRSWLP